VTLLAFNHSIRLEFLKRYLLIALVFVGFNKSYGYDSLTTAIRFYQTSQFQKALPIFLSLSKKYEAVDDIEKFALCQLKLADIIRTYGGPHVGLLLLEKSEQLLKVRLEQPSDILCETLLMKAECLYDICDFDAYRKTINEGIRTRKDLKVPDNIPVKEFMHRALYFQSVPNRRDSVEYWIRESLKLAKANPSKFSYVLPRIYMQLGIHVHLLNNRYYDNRKEFYKIINTSRLYYDSALKLLRKSTLTDSIMLGRIYHNLGNSYNNETVVTQQRETLDKAISYYNRSIAIAEKFGSPSDLALKNWVFAVAYERLNIRDSTLLQFQAGMKRLMPEFSPKTIRDIPPIAKTLNDKLYFTFPPQMLNQFYLKYKEQGNVDDLISAYQYGIYCIQSYQYLLSQTSSDQATVHGFYLFIEGYHQRLTEITDRLVAITHDTKYLRMALPYLISAKYAFLNQQDFDSKSFAESEAKTLRSELEIITRNTGKSNSHSGIGEFLKKYKLPISVPEEKTQRQAGNIEFDSLIVERIQTRIRNQNTAIIDYYWSGSGLYIVCITENEVSLKKYLSTQGLNELKSNIFLLRKNITGVTPKEFARHSYQIYSQVLDSVLQSLPKSIDHLIINPDSHLQLVPWDALVQDATSGLEFKNLKYLVNHYRIGIVLNLNHLFSKQQTFEQSFIGVASDFKNSKRFSELPFSTGLVKVIANNLDGKVSRSYPNELINTKIIHVATHVKADSLRPFQSVLYLSDGDSILLGDFEQRKTKAGLAILNACESGGLTYYRGEGTIGFGRTFYRMGAQSVLMTLWSVDDKATADILSEFYKQMESGKPLDISLSEAKRKFVGNAPTDELANPYYWAGLQLTGKTDPLFETSYYQTWSFTAGAVALIFTGLFFYRRNGKSFKSL
jgi:CHAT domain-containing protein/tetratricopeptide (TPR) repeat protein